MRKLLLIIFLLSFNNCYAVSLFGVSAEYVKNKITEVKTEVGVVKDNNLKLQNEMGVFRDNQLKMEMKIGQINNELSAKIVGIDKSVSSEMKAGRDAISGSGNTNDTKLMMNIIKTLGGICTALIVIISLTVKNLFTQIDSARFYQNNVARLSKNGEFDEMMKQKKEMEKEKSLLNKSINLYKRVSAKPPTTTT